MTEQQSIYILGSSGKDKDELGSRNLERLVGVHALGIPVEIQWMEDLVSKLENCRINERTSQILEFVQKANMMIVPLEQFEASQCDYLKTILRFSSDLKVPILLLEKENGLNSSAQFFVPRAEVKTYTGDVSECGTNVLEFVRRHALVISNKSK